MNKHLSSITCCCLLVVGAEVLAEVTANPSGATTDVNGVLTPQTSDTVEVDSTGGVNVVSIDNDAAENVTVNVRGAAELKPATPKSAINLGSGAAINILTPTSILASTISDKQIGTIVIRGANNSITNYGTIQSAQGLAIQGNIFNETADGTVLINIGTITTISSQTNSVQLGANAQVNNSGDILFEGGGGSFSRYC